MLDWIDANQLGRRNLSPDHFTLLLGRRYNRMKKAKNDGGLGVQKTTVDQIDTRLSTAEKLATEHHVSPATVKRAGKAAADFEVFPDEVKALVSSGESSITLATQFVELPPEAQQEALEVIAQQEATAKEVMREAVHNHRAQGTGENEWAVGTLPSRSGQ